jgi:hypothetical protein
MGWLKFRDGEQFVALPKSDPYSEIYTVRDAWWGLCDDRLLNPLDPDKKTIETDWKKFAELIQRRVQTFHKDIACQYHANTYVFYGDDKDHKAFGDVRWYQQTPSMLRGGVPPLANLLAGRGNADPGTGGQIVSASYGGKTVVATFVLKDGDENGDGTVPVRSGKTPASKVRARAAYPGIDHEGGYKPDATRRFTLWAITKIAQHVKGTVLEYKA